jgi:hypothetical protein
MYHEIRGLPLDGDAMARQGAAAARFDAAGGLSAEDAETLRGAGWLERDGAWYAPAYDLSVPGGLDSLRRSAHIIRAQKAPAAARNELIVARVAQDTGGGP